MHKARFMVSLILAVAILFVQAGGVFAASAWQNSAVAGVVQSITLETDPTTGITIVIVDLIDQDQMLQRVRVSQEKAIVLGFVLLNGDGKPDINNLALGKQVEIDLANVIPTKRMI
jgi:hypothetical protein